MSKYTIGQRYISSMEPELGLGMVTEVDQRIVHIRFPATDHVRQYAIASAPLTRVRFKPGDEIRSRKGERFVVRDIKEIEGLLVYQGTDQQLPEKDLADTPSFTSPLNRLLAGHMDSQSDYRLRLQAHEIKARILHSRVRGFVGGRIELIPHQLYVAHQVSQRQIPRVLLSDQVGLGKTIEAGLIIHRLLLNGRINRVIILVPDSLVHQWFVELYRRFNLVFRIYDHEYCESLAETAEGENIFMQDQWILSSLDFLAASPQWQQQAIAAEWDMLAVDEAHHLTEESGAYRFVMEVGKGTPGMLLLTATPELHGLSGHFARLRLLDPARYHDFNAFQRQEQDYAKIASMANKILDHQALEAQEKRTLVQLLPEYRQAIETGLEDDALRTRLIERLIDQHGMGRVLFRNTRAAIAGFPDREVHLLPLQADASIRESIDRQLLEPELKPNLDDDPRLDWLVSFLRKNRQKKILLICRSIATVYALAETLPHRINIPLALFHEQLSILQRDRHAAWFADPEGAQILICSEIGSEGRNFQFSQDLVLFDLPLDPELLEQRIGRLDRIGQKHTIQIHVPYIKESLLEILVRWYHEGMNGFKETIPGAFQIDQEMGPRVRALIDRRDLSELDAVVKETAALYESLTRQLQEGRDRLLELHSFDSHAAADLVTDIKKQDQSVQVDRFLLQLFDRYEIHSHEFRSRTMMLNFELLSTPHFPRPPIRKEDEFPATFDRRVALEREEVEFLSQDHPMVIGAIDALLGTETGNSTLAWWHDEQKESLWLETVFVAECVAPARLHVDRFLPPTPIRVMIDHQMKDLTSKIKFEVLEKKLKNARKHDILDNPDIRQHLLPGMLKQCQKRAAIQQKTLIDKGLKEMRQAYQNEIERLLTLKRVNPNIRSKEIEAWQSEQQELEKSLSLARLRLDAVRCIVRGPQ
jgi:ATP-dependent helicase HepA